MFAIHYILNDRIEIKRCKDEEELKIIYRALIKQGAIIKVVRDACGYKVNKIFS